jgi:hypothetical protein
MTEFMQRCMQACLASVRERLEATVAALRLPPWPPAAAGAWRRGALLLARRFGRGCRLLRALGAFEGVLARPLLLELALARLLQRQVGAGVLPCHLLLRSHDPCSHCPVCVS